MPLRLSLFWIVAAIRDVHRATQYCKYIHVACITLKILKQTKVQIFKFFHFLCPSLNLFWTMFIYTNGVTM